MLGIHELTRVGEHRSVGVYAEAGGHRPPEVVFLHVRPGCVFQPYRINTE